MVRVYGRDRKGRFVSRRSVTAKKAYRHRIERLQKARALVVTLSKLLNQGLTFAKSVWCFYFKNSSSKTSTGSQLCLHENAFS